MPLPHPLPPSRLMPLPHPSQPQGVLATSSLYKQKSWSPDTHRDEAWQKRKGNNGLRRRRRSKSVTDEDLEELKACIELGFGFDSPEMDQRLSDTFPAYGLYHAVNKHYNNSILKPAALASPLSSTVSDSDTPSPLGSPHTIFGLEYFHNKLVETIHFMEILNLKDSVEKDTFFRKLPSLAEQLPREIVLKKLLPLLASALEFGSAAVPALTAFLKLGSWLSTEEFGSKVVPTVVKLFASNDRAIRVGHLHF